MKTYSVKKMLSMIPENHPGRLRPWLFYQHTKKMFLLHYIDLKGVVRPFLTPDFEQVSDNYDGEVPVEYAVGVYYEEHKEDTKFSEVNSLVMEHNQSIGLSVVESASILINNCFNNNGFTTI